MESNLVGVTIRGQDGVCGDELLPDQSETQAKTGTMASKTNFLRLIDMVRERGCPAWPSK
jgi:hypothetical protein